MEVSKPFSLIIPVLNEEENIPSLVNEIASVEHEQDEFEVIFVDDHSTDRTPAVLKELSRQFPWLRTVRLKIQSGQSAALWYGIHEARFPLIVTMDGDGQNDPADIKHMIDACTRLQKQTNCCLVNGLRTKRKDSGWRKISSLLANRVRSLLLGDDTPDSGCGIKVFPRDTFLVLPAFNHMHRFLPALIRQRGGIILSVSVHHRPRLAGRSHYGTMDRLLVGIVDLMGMLWLGRRTIRQNLVEEM